MKEYKLKISEENKEILEKGRIEENLYFLPDTQLSREKYVEINKLLEMLGGKWNRSKKAHVFNSSEEAKSILKAQEDGEVLDKKKTYQFFETPSEVAKRMVELADIKNDMIILEPSAGHGAISKALADGYTQYNCALIQVELDPKKCKVLESQKIGNVICADFLGTFADEYGQFDRILMNPPFTKSQDVTHILHAFNKCLYPNGKLVAIASASVEFNSNKKYKELRELIEKYGTIEKLPESTFKESGTNVNTVIITLTKPEND